MNKAIEFFLCVVIVLAMFVGFFGLIGFLMADFTMIPVMLAAGVVAFAANRVLVVMVEKSVTNS